MYRILQARILYLQKTLKLDIQNACAHIDLISTPLQHPFLLRRTPDTQIPPREGKAERRALPRSQRFLLEASQLLWWRVGNSDVELGDLCSGDRTSVGDRAIDSGDGGEKIRISTLCG